MLDENGYGAVGEYCFGNAAMQQVPESGPAMGRHNDAVAVVFLDRVEDFSRRLAIGGHGLDRHTCRNLVGYQREIDPGVLNGRDLLALPFLNDGDRLGLPIHTAWGSGERRSNENQIAPPHTGEANGIRQRTFGQVRTIQWDNESMKHDQASVCERRR